jgi:peptide/nickel transport system substrate-binding protein
MSGVRLGQWAALSMAAVLVAAGGCTRAGQSQAPSDVLRIALNINPTQLNPILTQNTIESFTDGLIFSELVTQDAQHHQIPDLASIVPTLANGGVSKDGLTITYHLRKGVRWHDGAPFTSKDVVFTWHAIMSPSNNVVSRRGYDQIASMAAPDAYTVVLHMKRFFAPAIDTIFGESDTPMKILPEHLLSRYPDLNHIPFNAAPVGTGAYRFVRWLRSDHIELAANESYFKGRPHFARLLLKIIPDDNTMLAQIRAHEVDVALEIPAPVYRDAEGAPGVTRQLAQAPVYTAVQFNTQKSPLDDVRVRRALVMGINREQLVRDDSYGTASVAVADLSPYYWAFDHSLSPVSYDPNGAKALLDAAGWHPGPDGIRSKDGRRLSLLYVYGTGSQLVRTIIAQVQQMYRPLGIDVQLKGYDYATLYAAAQSGGILNGGLFDMAMYSWVSGADPDDSSQWTCAAIPPNGNNVSRYCSHEMDGLQRTALSTFDRGARAKTYARIQALLLRDSPAGFFYYQALRYVRAPWLQHFEPNGISEAWNAEQWSR